MSPAPASAPPRVEPLRCEACAAAIPLPEGDEARCPFCSAVRPLPQAYRAVRDAQRLAEADRAALESSCAEATRPPPGWMQAWALAGGLVGSGAVLATVVLTVVLAIGVLVIDAYQGLDALPGALIAAVVMLFLAVPAAFEWLLHLLGAHGHDLADALGPWLGVALGLVLFALVVAPVIWGAYCAEGVEGLRALQAELAARPPAQPGGPALCRVCGAPFLASPGATGVRCAYCSADNLLLVAEPEASQEAKAASGLHQRVETALATRKTQRATERAALPGRLLVGLLVVVPLFGLLGLPAHMIQENGVTPTLFGRAPAKLGTLWPDDPANPPLPQATEQSFALRFPHFSCIDRSGEQCAEYYVALRQGEALRLEGALGGVEATLQRHGHGWRTFAGEAWVAEPGLEQAAPYTGWYRLELRARPGTHQAPVRVRWGG